jgi:hypothetical protein
MMWEQWRAEIDRATRDAELAQDHPYDHEARTQVRGDRASFLSRHRLFRRRPPTTAPRRQEIPLSWRIRGAPLHRPGL